MRSGLLPEASFEFSNPRLDRGHLTFEIGDAFFDDLAPPLLVGQQRLDAAQRLRDREVFLLEPLETTVDLVEVTEYFAAESTQFSVEAIEPAVDLGEPALDLGEPALDLGELALEELNELLVLGVRHPSRVAPRSGSLQVSPICDTERAA